MKEDIFVQEIKNYLIGQPATRWLIKSSPRRNRFVTQAQLIDAEMDIISKHCDLDDGGKCFLNMIHLGLFNLVSAEP